MNKFNGKIICGEIGGDTFEKVRRPDSETGLCQDGTSPCSSSTSVVNTLCYPEELHESSCPITEISIADQITVDLLKNEEYTILSY